jgi:hypothetical protein
MCLDKVPSLGPTPDNHGRIAVGMKKSEVEAILGKLPETTVVGDTLAAK